MLCRHCGRNGPRAGRGLCIACYAKPAVRSRYPLLCAHGHPGEADFNGTARPAERATDAVPGSEEKIAILTERAAERRELWHPEDGRGIMS